MVELIIAAVFIIILAVCAFIGLNKGFIRMVAGFIEYIISFFIAYVFCSRLAVYVKKIPFIAKMVTDTEMPEFPEGAGLLEKAKTIVSYLVNDAISGGNADTKAIANNYLADGIAYTVAFIALFLVALLIQKLIVYFLDLIAKAPVLKQANGVLGFIFGLFCGSFWTWLLANVFVRGVLPILTAKYPVTFPAELADSAIMKFFLTANPVSLILNGLTWIANKFTIVK